MFFYELESTEVRRARRNSEIRDLFYRLTIEEGFSFMEAYEAVGYHFFLSADQVRDILARRKKKCGKPAQLFRSKAVPLSPKKKANKKKEPKKN